MSEKYKFRGLSAVLLCSVPVFIGAPARAENPTVAGQDAQTPAVMTPTKRGQSGATHRDKAGQRQDAAAGQSDPMPGEDVEVEGQRTHSAIYQAPTSTPLTVTQPTFVVNRHFIENNLPASANYDTIATIAPSVAGTSPNGPGLSESINMTLRGFVDGQYDVLFDDIPVAQTNDNTHHTTSYYQGPVTGSVVVNAGPGDAATVGFATFGGQIYVNSVDPKTVMSAEAHAMAGSFDSYNYGAQYNSGLIRGTNGGRLVVDVEGTTSHGYANYSALRRANYFLKYVQPLGAHTTLTASGFYNHVDSHQSPGATRAQIAEYGPKFGLTNDPTKQNYEGYNLDVVQSDLEYVGIKSDLGAGWQIEDKVYTFAYYHQPGLSGKDPNGGTPNGTSFGPDNVPGTRMKMNYRAWGDILKIRKSVSIVDFQTGVWVDHQSNGRDQYSVDYTLGGRPDPGKTKGGKLNPPVKAFSRLMHDQNLSVQPFVQADVHITKELIFSAGFKWADFSRDLEAPINQKTKTPLYYSSSYGTPLPSFSFHYMFTPKWAGYIQVARGFEAPSLSYYYVPDPSQNAISPEKTWNYQIGTSYQSRRYSVSADFYYIDFSNMIVAINDVSLGDSLYRNVGSTRYYGVEFSGSYYLGRGISLFANGSYNQARLNSDNSWVPYAPDATAAGGITYNDGPFYASLIDKWVGASYGDTGNKQGIDPYNTLNLSLAYTVPTLIGPMKNVKLKLNVNNLLNSHNIYYFNGYAKNGTTGLFYSQPGLGVFGSVSVPFQI
ncbi:TonB-dependent receptor [Gluconacetobacter sacchari]|uniref:TonB-dependent receptor n=2 Tax=Gluconacetobacter sacchari TaxID=92759 RepID=A0A7W4ICE7_9PROT|nr:TonB-dependent receptor [Gluconacetobacter sacchari]MBB2160284.1 TonB-dependent receptor [Gluconacetobacter sacchari]